MSAVPAQLLESVRQELITDPDAPAAASDPGRLHAAVRDRSAGLGGAATLELLRGVQAELTGAGPLAGLLTDPDVTDVLVNGPGEVWADRGAGLQRLPLAFATDDDVRRLAVRLASAAGRRLDTGMPFVDARLPGGVRLHAVLPPVAVGGVCLSLRIHRQRPLDLSTLLRTGSLQPAFARVLDAMIAARLSFVISGGAGTGKTTLLGALLARAGPQERILVVEDAAELAVSHPHVVRLEARPANVEGAGEVTLRDLVRQALRMRPDRVIVGEVRGPEVLDMLLAGNTGHEGAITTVHANGVTDVPARIEALAMLAGIARPAAHSLLGSAVCAAVHLHRSQDGTRRVAEIAVLRRRDGGLVRAVSALRWAGAEEPVHVGPGAEPLQALLVSHGVTPPAILEPS
jgi:pilus assembly protein CpaF